MRRAPDLQNKKLDVKAPFIILFWIPSHIMGESVDIKQIPTQIYTHTHTHANTHTRAYIRSLYESTYAHMSKRILYHWSW